MHYDPIPAWRGHMRRRGFGWLALLGFLMVFALSMVQFLRECEYEFVDMNVHMLIASDFDFTDLHSITSRLSYPMWHLIVSVLYQLGMPLNWAAAGVSALCKSLTFLFSYWLILSMAGEDAKSSVAALLSLAVMFVSAVRIPSVSYSVYLGIGSPNVWHNPTQQIVTAAMMLVMPWLAHCWYAFEKQLDEGKKRITLPWWKIVVLAVLCMGSVACKPTFMQALLPAAFVMYLVELVRHREEWRYFGQIVLAFLPTVGYFLLSYLYYTGVVVEFTSGVEFGVTAQTAWVAMRNTLMMSLCPLFALIVCYRKGLFKDRLIVLALLMTLFSTLEAMAFRETGLREGHGNFTWAADSSAFFLWVVMGGTTLRCFLADRKAHALTLLKKAGYGATLLLLIYHLYSGLYYLHYLLTTANAM